MFVSTLIKKTARRLEKKANELLKPYGITHAYTNFLMELYVQDGMSQTELHQRIGIEQPTAVRNLDRMERDGFIMRKQSNIDRRVLHIYLTEKGQEVKEHVEAAAKQLNALLLSGLNTDEQCNFTHLLTRSLQNMDHP